MIFHVHLTAPEEILRRRYADRAIAGGEYAGNTSYEEAIKHPNEVAARQLKDIADYSIDLAQVSPSAAAAAIYRRWEDRRV